MPLNEQFEITDLPEAGVVFVERSGPIPQNAPLAWQQFHRLRPQLEGACTIFGFLALYRLSPPVYRAGAAVAAAPRAALPEGLRFERVAAGTFARFVLTGPYAELPDATRRAFAIVGERGRTLRQGFHMERYVNDPAETAEDRLVTEILLAVDGRRTF